MQKKDKKTLIEELLFRSVDTIYPSKEALQELLEDESKKLRVYIGIDPTANYVHLGHSTNYLVLERFQKLGHKVIVLVGDFTAAIGDPTDKTSARVRLSRDEILHNLATFKEQISKVINFEDPENPVEFVFNRDWLSRLSFEDVVELASHFTVQQMIERDMFEKRLKENKPLYVHEFFYPLMQGYDSVALDVDVEIGGTDQTFNMLTGRTLLKKYKNKEKFVFVTTLLVNPKTGEKLMSKSLGTGIGLNEEANSMYKKAMNLADEGIIQTFIDCTRISYDKIRNIEDRFMSGENPRDIKMELAYEIVRMYHGEQEAQSAQKHFIQAFSENSVPDDVTELTPTSYDLITILVESTFVSSKSDARRVIEQGGVKVDGEVVVDFSVVVSPESIIQKGKGNFLKVL